MKYIELYVNEKHQFTMPLHGIEYDKDGKGELITLLFMNYESDAYKATFIGTKKYIEYIEFLIKGSGDFVRINIDTNDKEFYSYILEGEYYAYRCLKDVYRTHDYYIDDNGNSVLDEEEANEK